MEKQDYLVSGHPDEIKWLEDYAVSLLKHIEAVREAGKQLGVSLAQLLSHDRSKYDVEEFPHYARLNHGDAGDPDGFARAWLHHIHHNPHHWQHWIFPDYYWLKGSTIEEGGIMEMPENYALEMVADWMGSSFVYTGSWNMTDWLKKNQYKIVLHSNTTAYVRGVLESLDYGYGHLFKTEADE